MRHKRQPRSQMERYRGSFFVGHSTEFAEEMECFVAGELFDESVELRTVASHFVNLRNIRYFHELRDIEMIYNRIYARHLELHDHVLKKQVKGFKEM